MKHIPLFGIALLLLACTSLVTAQHGIYFDYHHPNPEQPVHINHPHVDGVFLRFAWADLEPAKGHFDFSVIDRNIAVWSAAGKKVLFGVSLAGQHNESTPDWVYKEVSSIDFIRSGKESKVRTPRYWDPGFIPAVSGLVEALGKYYAEDPRVEAVMIGVGHIGFLTAAPNGAGAKAFIDSGWTPDIWKQYTWNLCGLYRKAFANKPLFIRGSSLVLREPDPARAGFPDSQPHFIDIRDEILLEAATRFNIGIGCNGLEGDPDKFLASGIPNLYQQLADGAIHGKYRLEISDDWPLWVNPSRRERSKVDSKADNAYYRQCLDNIVGGKDGLPRIPIGWVKMLETDLDCTDPANADYQPDCEDKLVWLKQQLLGPVPAIGRFLQKDAAASIGSPEIKINGEWIQADVDRSVVQLENIPAIEIQMEFNPEEQCQLHGIRFPLELDKLIQVANDWMIFGDDYNALGQGTILPLDQAAGPASELSWISCLYSPSTRQTLVVAAGKAEKWPTWIVWTANKKNQPGLIVRFGGQTSNESIRLASGQTVEFDPLIVGVWIDIPPQEALIQMARTIGKSIGRSSPPRRPEPGWCSWMYHAGKVSAEDVRQAAQFMAEDLKCAGYGLVQVDGGWWNGRGEWEPNERFPEGIAGLADQVHNRGLQFGLHYSPFRIDATSPVSGDHPDWLLHDIDSGEILSEGGRGKAYILDGSHPEVLEYTQNTLKRLIRDGKVDYLKLDFLYHGAAEARRYNPSKTGVEALSDVMQTIRESVPPETIILGCNLPGLIAARYVDSVRVGPDINKVGLGHVGPNGEHANMKWGNVRSDLSVEHQNLVAQAQAVARQFFTHNAFWVNDPDSVMVTPDYTLEEARAHMTLVALTGGSLFLGDRLETLPEERVALLMHPGVLDLWLQGLHAIPVDLFSGEPVPSLWKVELDDSTVLGIFNWEDTASDRTWRFADLWLDPACQYTVRDIWSGQQSVVTDGRLSLNQVSHSVRLLEFRKLK